MSLADELPIAVNTFVWHSPLTDDLMRQQLPKIAAWGFDGVEMPLESPGDWDPHAAGELLTALGLRSVVGAVFGPGRDLAAAAPDAVARTLDYLREAIDAAAAQGAAMVIGPMYTSVGRTWRMTSAGRAAAYRQLREGLARAAEHAGARGVRLAVEPLNRYETSLINTTEQLMEVIDTLPCDIVGINLDTYHMNIEERSFAQAIRTAGRRLLHLQVCGNDRGAPGLDHLDWSEIGAALRAIRYRGMLGIESFTADNATIATAASIWRPLSPSQDQLATDGLAFLRDWRAGWAGPSA